MVLSRAAPWPGSEADMLCASCRGRTGIFTPSHLYARLGRHALQPGSQSKIRSAHSRRQATKSRPNCNHAKAHRNRKCSPARWAEMVGNQALTKTDTHLPLLGGDDEPKTLLYAITSICPKGADAGQITHHTLPEAQQPDIRAPGFSVIDVYVNSAIFGLVGIYG